VQIKFRAAKVLKLDQKLFQPECWALNEECGIQKVKKSKLKKIWWVIWSVELYRGSFMFVV
jgi:hypothetical protein